MDKEQPIKPEEQASPVEAEVIPVTNASTSLSDEKLDSLDQGMRSFLEMEVKSINRLSKALDVVEDIIFDPEFLKQKSPGYLAMVHKNMIESYKVRTTNALKGYDLGMKGTFMNRVFNDEDSKHQSSRVQRQSKKVVEVKRILKDVITEKVQFGGEEDDSETE